MLLAILLSTFAYTSTSDASSFQEFETFLTKTYSTKSDRDPVILLPGLCGSRLQYKNSSGSTWGTLWLQVSSFLNYPAWSYRITPDYDAETETYSTKSDISVRAQDYGGIDGIASLETYFKILSTYYGAVIAALKSTGYTVGTDLFGAPYDWRLSTPNTIMTNGMAADLKELVEYAYELNSRPVVLVGHSMGTAFIYEFLTRYVTSDWKNTYIKQIILISPPLGGAVVALANIATPHLWEAYPLPPKMLYNLTQNLAGVHWMLPNYNAWDENTTIASITVGSNDTVYITPANMSYCFNTSGREDLGLTCERMVNNETNHFEPPEVPVHVIYSNGKNTTQFLTYTCDADENWYEQDCDVTYGDGDQIVPLESLTAAQKWADQQEQNVTMSCISDQTHLGILKSEDLIDYIIADVARD